MAGSIAWNKCWQGWLPFRLVATLEAIANCCYSEAIDEAHKTSNGSAGLASRSLIAHSPEIHPRCQKASAAFIHSLAFGCFSYEPSRPLTTHLPTAPWLAHPNGLLIPYFVVCLMCREAILLTTSWFWASFFVRLTMFFVRGSTVPPSVVRVAELIMR